MLTDINLTHVFSYIQGPNGIGERYNSSDTYRCETLEKIEMIENEGIFTREEFIDHLESPYRVTVDHREKPAHGGITNDEITGTHFTLGSSNVTFGWNEHAQGSIRLSADQATPVKFIEICVSTETPSYSIKIDCGTKYAAGKVRLVACNVFKFPSHGILTSEVLLKSTNEQMFIDMLEHVLKPHTFNDEASKAVVSVVGKVLCKSKQNDLKDKGLQISALMWRESQKPTSFK